MPELRDGPGLRATGISSSGPSLAGQRKPYTYRGVDTEPSPAELMAQVRAGRARANGEPQAPGRKIQCGSGDEAETAP